MPIALQRVPGPRKPGSRWRAQWKGPGVALCTQAPPSPSPAGTSPLRFSLLLVLWVTGAPSGTLATVLRLHRPRLTQSSDQPHQTGAVTAPLYR